MRSTKFEIRISKSETNSNIKGSNDKNNRYFAIPGKSFVPQTPAFVKGVINLRGKVIPVMDLRLRFSMEEIAYNDRTCIVVAEVASNSGTVMIGIVVDSVSEVLNIKGDDIEETPTFGTKLKTDYILGMAKMEGGVKILLDIDQVLNREEVTMIETRL